MDKESSLPEDCISVHRKRLNPEDAEIYKGTLPDNLNWCDPTTSVYDSPTPENKENQGDVEKLTSAKCAICDFPKKGKNQRLYCMCGQ
jgi:hypothetical protein